MRTGKRVRQSRRNALPPGPRWPAWTQMVAFGIRPTWFLEHCARRYEDCFTVRFPSLPGFGGEMVFVTHPDLVRDVFAGGPELMRGGERLQFLASLLGPKSVLLLDGDEHHRQRRLMLPALHGEAIASLREQVTEIANREIDTWVPGASITIRPRMQSITLSVIISLVLGVEPERAEPFHQAMSRLIKKTFTVGIPALFLLSRRPKWRVLRFMPWSAYARAADDVDALLFEEVRRQRSDPIVGSKRHVLATLLQARDEHGEPMTDAEIRDELVTLLLAGYETSATGLSWTIDLLAHEPEIACLLKKSLLEGDRQYLNAVVAESLRLRPPLPLAGRLLTASWRVGNHPLPAGTNVVACTYLVHRRADLYPEPEAFRPERFVNHAPERNAWIPFGGGYRRCIGASLATLEMEEVLATVVARAKWRPTKKRPEKVRRRNIVFTPARGTSVVVEQIVGSRELSSVRS